MMVRCQWCNQKKSSDQSLCARCGVSDQSSDAGHKDWCAEQDLKDTWPGLFCAICGAQRTLKLVDPKTGCETELSKDPECGKLRREFRWSKTSALLTFASGAAFVIVGRELYPDPKPTVQLICACLIVLTTLPLLFDRDRGGATAFLRNIFFVLFGKQSCASTGESVALRCACKKSGGWFCREKGGLQPMAPSLVVITRSRTGEIRCWICRGSGAVVLTESGGIVSGRSWRKESFQAKISVGIDGALQVERDGADGRTDDERSRFKIFESDSGWRTAIVSLVPESNMPPPSGNKRPVVRITPIQIFPKAFDSKKTRVISLAGCRPKVTGFLTALYSNGSYAAPIIDWGEGPEISDSLLSGGRNIKLAIDKSKGSIAVTVNGKGRGDIRENTPRSFAVNKSERATFLWVNVDFDLSSSS